MKPRSAEHLIPRPFTEMGSYLQHMRLKAGFTQREVSEKLEYSSSQHISNIEAGIQLPPKGKLPKLVKMLSLDKDRTVRLILRAKEYELRELLD